jgi:asparagine synthase (glutamine-hydrolysing)
MLLDVFAGTDAPDLLDAMLDADVRWYLPDALLVKVDIATMAHGLEGRSPLLDHEVMEFAASLPSRLKLRNRTTKYLFKDAVRPLLPPDVIDRPKRGFAVPLDHWFRRELRELVHDVLLSERCISRGYFRRDGVARLLEEHVSGARNRHHHLWTLLMLELWHRAFIDVRPRTIPYTAGVVSDRRPLTVSAV